MTRLEARSAIHDDVLACVTGRSRPLRRHGRRVALAMTVAIATFVGAAMTPAHSLTRVSSEQLPSGFTDTRVASINLPIAFAQTPDGRMLVVDETGFIDIVKNGVVLAKPALNIKSKVCSKGYERGLLSIALDPSFATNGYLYVYYTFKKYPKCPRYNEQVPVNRVSRFTMSGNTIDPASEVVLVDNMLSYAGEHNAGDVGFGKDGMLYVTTGDGGCDYTVGRHACDENDNTNGISQKLNTLQGKVLRIAPDGSIPQGNPFTGAGSARCNEGYVATGLKCQEIYSYGLRNPFRFAFDENATNTRLFVDDVGESTWEEVDQAKKGANFGWNTREGDCVEGSLVDCGAPPPGMTNPVYSYSHEATDCASITGAAFVPNGLWGAHYNRGYLYSDYICNKIFLMRPDGAGGWTATAFATGLAPQGPIAMGFASYSGHAALYYTTYANGGELHVIDRAP